MVLSIHYDIKSHPVSRMRRIDVGGRGAVHYYFIIQLDCVLLQYMSPHSTEWTVRKTRFTHNKFSTYLLEFSLNRGESHDTLTVTLNKTVIASSLCVQKRHPGFSVLRTQNLRLLSMSPEPSPRNPPPPDKRRVVVVSSTWTQFVLDLLRAHLSRHDVRVTYSTRLDIQLYRYPHIIIAPNTFMAQRFPPVYYAVQLEQSAAADCRWFTPQYLSILRGARGVLEYSPLNLQYLSQKGIQAELFRLGTISTYAEESVSDRRPSKVILYGSMNTRRRQALRAMKKMGIDVHVISGIFGRELRDKLRREASVVVNIHYYQNAMLEQVRLCECLSLGIPVVSELSVDMTYQPAELLRAVRFVPRADAAAMASALRQVMREPPQLGSVPSDCSSLLRMLSIAPRRREPQAPRPQPAPVGKNRVGVVVTTHGNFGAIARNCVHSFMKHLPQPYYLLLVINVSDDPITAALEQEVAGVPQVEVLRIAEDVGGLTATWNLGIDKCVAHRCDVILLSNHDLYVDSSIEHLVRAARECPRGRLRYFGPLTNNPGPAKCNLPQKGSRAISKDPFVLQHGEKMTNINGFLMCFPRHVLEANRFDTKHYFDPSLPYGGNETEWFHRLIAKRGQPMVVPRTFVHHYKFASWRQTDPSRRAATEVCLYTINTGGYERGAIVRGDKFKNECDMLYYSDSPEMLQKATAMGWIPMYILPGFDNKLHESKLLQRTIKTCPHLYLPHQYETSIYIDGNVIPLWTNIHSLFHRIEVDKYDLVCWKHPVRTTVRDEGKEVVKNKLETQEHVQRILDMMQKDDFLDTSGLTETCMLIRKHHRIVPFSEDWRSAVEICRRDQISFDYLVWKHKTRIVKLPISSRPLKKKRHSGNTRNRTVIK